MVSFGALSARIGRGSISNTLRALFAVGLFQGSFLGPVSLARADAAGGSATIVASSGFDRLASVGQTIQLDASSSTSGSGRALTYRWTVVKLPMGSAARLSDAASVRPTFIVDVAGDYVFSVTAQAKEGEGGPAPASATVVVSTASVAPVADAGLNRRVSVGATVALDGARSFDANGDAISYQWALVKRPKGSAAALSSATAARPTLTIDAEGAYVAELVVTDATGKSSAPSRVVFSTRDKLNGRASAGPAQLLSKGATARVDADGTYLPPGRAASPNANWALLSKPAGSAALLKAGPDARQAATLDLAGDYVVQLALPGASREGENDDDAPPRRRDARFATSLLTTGNVAPVANAGDDQRIAVGAKVSLDGSRSTDLNGDPLTYRWALISRPAGSAAKLDDPASVKPTFAADVAGSYVAQLVVDDSFGHARPATVVIATDAAAPVAVAGPDPLAHAGAAVSLDGSASRDPESGALAPTWTILGLGDQLPGKLSAPSSLVTDFIIAPAGTTSAKDKDEKEKRSGPALKLAIAQLVVENRLLFSSDDVVVSTVEARPVAMPQQLGPVYRGVAVQLDGSTSVNPNLSETPNGGLTYKWSLLSRPATSTAQIGNATSARPTLKPDVYGRYVIQLIVSDGVLDSRPRTLVLDVSTRQPVATIVAKSPVLVAQTAAFDGSASVDPDGNALSFSWTLKGAPAGSQAALTDIGAPVAHLIPDVAGSYVVQLIVSDAYGASTPATATIVAQGGFVFTPIPAQSVALGSSLAFTVVAKDSGGKPVSYAYSGALPTGASFDVTTGAFKFRPQSNDPSGYSFTFQATNGKDVITQTVPVMVTGSPSGTTSGLAAKVYDAVDYANGVLTPVPNVVVSVGAASTTSDTTGAVSLSGLPAGQEILAVSAAGAAPAPDGALYLDTVVSAPLIAGVTNTLDGPILLARASSGGSINGSGTTKITNPGLGVTLTIAPNSAFNADGTPYTGQISIGSLPPNTPVNLPPGFAPCQLLVISPTGVTFNPAAQLTVVNNDKLPPGAQVDLWAFDPQLGASRVVGVGKVSADAATITTYIGGVPGGTILAMAPRRAGLAEVGTQPGGTFSPSVLRTGDLATSFSPPGTRVLNGARSLTFVYHSSTAVARPVLGIEAGFAPGLGLPQTLTTRLDVDGVTQATTLVTDLSKPLSGAALNGSKQNTLMQAGVADATSLPSGSHRYSFLTIAKFACSAVGTQAQGDFVVNNQSQSAFGAGWQLAELQKLNKQSGGSLAIVEGNGRTLIAHAEQAPDFLPNPVYIPVAGPYRGAVTDLTGRMDKPSILRLAWKPILNKDGTSRNTTRLEAILNKGGRQFIKSAIMDLGPSGGQNPDGSFAPKIYDVAAGDVTNDGVADVGVISDGSSINIYSGASGGIFLPTPVSVEDHAGGGNIIMADLVGIGTVDPVISEGVNSFPDYHLIFNDGAGHLTFAQNGNRLPGNPLGMVTVRFPGFVHDSFAGVTSDGSLLIAYGGATATLPWSRGVGKVETTFPRYNVDAFLADATFADRVVVSSNIRQGNVGRILATADIDGSGNPAFAIAAADGVYIVKWRAPGANNQAIAQVLKLPSGLAPDSVALAPLAKGNRASLIATANTAGFYVFQSDGKGNFNPTPIKIDTPFRVGIEADVVDFDGDGVADVALNDLDNDRVAVFFGNPHPDGAFVSPIGDYTRLVQNSDGTYSRIYNDGTVVTFNANGFQTGIADANGNVTSYGYNGQGQLTQIVEPTGKTTAFAYSGSWLSSTTDGAGRTTSYDHDGSGNLTKVTDPLGNVTQYLYDANHQLVATIDPNGGKTSNTYTSTGQLKGQTYADGSSIKLDVSKALGLDALGVDLGGPTNAAFVSLAARITQMQDAKGNLSETEVNEWGAVVRVTDVLGRVSRFYRDDANHVVRSEIPAGTSTGPIAPSPLGLPQVGSSDTLVNEYLWDERGNLIQLHEGVGHGNDPQTGDILDRLTSYIYEPTHNKLIQKTDAEGNVSKWSYDANGNMTALTDAMAGVTAYTYDPRGLALTKTDQLGHVTAYAYDNNGNLSRATDALGTTFERYYDPSGNLILTIDAAGTAIARNRASRYDANNRVIEQTSAAGQVTATGYDGNGNVIQIVDPAGNVTRRTYDANNRLLSETTPDAGTSSFAYDVNGNRLTATDASGAVTSFAYDAANRTLSVTDALGAPRSLAYDLRDNPVSIVNARGKTTALGYDVFKRRNARVDPLGGRWLTHYDRIDNPVSLAAPSGQTQALAYDPLQRLIREGGSSFAYDAASNLVSVRGDTGVGYDYAYDALNRPSGMQTVGYPVSVAFSYAYDPLSRRIATNDNFGAVTRYAYDAEDRVTTITAPWGRDIAQSYDFAGRPQRLVYPNGLEADLSFEAQTGRLASVAHTPTLTGNPILKFDHVYDIRGNLSALSELAGTKTFTYDKVERLTGAAWAAPPQQIESYSYDAEGNRIASHISAGYSTDAADRVLEDADNLYSWSPDGQLTRRQPKAANATAWNFISSFRARTNQMRLDSIRGSDGRNIAFAYDPLERLVGHQWPAPRGNDELYYDGPDVVLELRHLSGGDQWARYVPGPQDDQPLATELYAQGAQPTPGTGAQFYYHADGEGSIHMLSDAVGVVANRYDYDSFGRRLAVVESLPLQPYGWKGREWVPGPDVYYNRARFYDPVLGRFLAQDPLGYGGGDWNVYGFARNNPRKWSDPTGLSATEEAETTGVAMAAAPAEAGLGAQVACTFGTLASVLTAINDPSLGTVVGFSVQAGACSVGVIYERGKAAEGAVRGVVDIGIKTVQKVAGRDRIPDGINVAAKTVNEVKAVAYQALTSQLKDYIQIAKDKEFQFVLYVYENTVKLSGPLKKAIADGVVKLQNIPPH